jgi:DNA-binding IclR family transcriptional regulator
MTHTYEELHKKTLAELREIAKGVEHEAVKGYTQMHKERLLPALCAALGIEAHEHHVVVGLDKTKVKVEIRRLKGKRDQAVEAHDRKELKALRRRIHRLKRRIHAATV